MKRLTLITATLLLFFVLNSCKKTGDALSKHPKDYSEILAKLRNIKNDQKGNKPNSKIYARTTALDYSNPDNPYDWVGIKHNDCLDYVSSYMSDITNNSSGLSLTIRQPLNNSTTTATFYGRTDKTIALTQKYWNENVMDSYVAPYVKESSFSNDDENTITKDNIDYFKQHNFVDPRLSGLNAFNNDFYSKLQYFVDAGKLTSFEANADSIVVYQAMETDSLEQSIAIIIEAEKIIQEASLEDAVKTRQLVFLSIFRNSIGYWANVIEDESNLWWTTNRDFFTRVGSHEGYARWSWHKFWGVLLTGLADAVGGVVGALIEPPVLGAAVGGVVGAALSAVVDNVYP